jgi:predicted small lipoprotein YifL
MMKKTIFIICLILAVLCFMTGCGQNSADDLPAQDAAQPKTEALDEGKTIDVAREGAAEQDKNKMKDDSNTDSKTGNQTGSKTKSNMGGVKKENISKDKVKAATESNKTVSSKSVDPVPQSTEKCILIKGSGVSKEIMINLPQLQNMKGQVAEYTYFSRGKEPKTAYNTYKGVKLSYLISMAGLKEDSQKVMVVGTDGYTASFSLSDVKEMLMDETDTGKSLPMMIAFAEDGKTLDSAGGCPFRLVMGQKCEGDYNRQYWVRDVCSIVVK